MINTALIPWLDPEILINGFGPWALLGVCAIVFAETGLLIGFLLPGDTLLVITGLFVFFDIITIDIWWVALAIGGAAFIGGEVGYLIGHRLGPRVFERKESGLFSVKNVQRTNAFFVRFGGFAVIAARFVPIVRTFAPVAAGVGHMDYRKYSLYNFIGAMIWGAGLTFFGYFLGYIPPLADFVRDYIDLILLGAVVLTLLPTIYHYVQSTVKARRQARAGVTVDPKKLVLDPETFNTDNDGKHEA
ncbi:DedA family protein [Cryobacterium adonitolivorans]|uniref:DedA family protein n=1 Tax=Cryobacterium adonitolivorans TaxID=1259189 RepID=A0A4R8VYQ7_9MICO|nr:VTT domain-containing protein [Cryobacterium adonitolivorans]TFB97473.1 DedA family protein [Cryobacterium adonitolivorans]